MSATACAAWYERQLQDTTISYHRQHQPQAQGRAKAAAAPGAAAASPGEAAATVGEKAARHGDRQKQKKHTAKQSKGAENDTVSEKAGKGHGREGMCGHRGYAIPLPLGWVYT